MFFNERATELTMVYTKLSAQQRFVDSEYTEGEPADLSGMDLRYMKFCNRDFTGVNFTGANMKGVKFKNCKLTSCIWDLAAQSEIEVKNCEGLVLTGDSLVNGLQDKSIAYPIRLHFHK